MLCVFALESWGGVRSTPNLSLSLFPVCNQPGSFDVRRRHSCHYWCFPLGSDRFDLHVSECCTLRMSKESCLSLQLLNLQPGTLLGPGARAAAWPWGPRGFPCSSSRLEFASSLRFVQTQLTLQPTGGCFVFFILCKFFFFVWKFSLLIYRAFFLSFSFLFISFFFHLFLLVGG